MARASCIWRRADGGKTGITTTCLIPQFVFLAVGLTGATFYLIRLARGPHVTLWDRKNNPEPWNKLDPTYQYKFVAVNTDYKNLKKDGPDF
ncbi:cytochrome c oxidase subunit NDUFA4 isoform X1 [Acanthopagrus latus]|uniref:cytochrome c oxidase subunit NDUFA4 isoform X1 n=1 Tax=Acanthopagrus latus TaxID=8177 RepID=UPI00187CE80F|nr:cytochrome c oxidase subunit NDUFA4 isoform X1 [Acanthopagrus latus]